VCAYFIPLTSIYCAWTASGGWRGHRRIGLGDHQEAPHGGCSLEGTRSVWPTCGVGRPPVGPSGCVLSRGGCQVGPQVSSRYPQDLEAVWTGLWAMGYM
jgi:hypothetical protein